MDHFQKIINNDEKILWHGGPKFLPYLLSSFVSVPFGIFILGFCALWINSTSSMTPDTLNPLTFFITPFVIVGLTLMLIPVYRLLVHQSIKYAITDRRVMLQSGLIGKDFEIIDFDKIQNSYVNVGIIDKLFGGGSGSISIDAGRLKSTKYGSRSHPYVLISVDNPYNVFKFFKKVSFDIKTDMHYPNAMRPQSNPGYKTDYPNNNDISQ
jgi:membrane protein YdbS with pleckstrin-like domain